MLIEAKLPARFWAEAAATAVYLLNYCPRKGKGNNTLKLWTGRVPNVKHLRTFGCTAFYFVPKPLLNKLQSSGKRGIFLGYYQRRAYRIYDLETGKVMESRSVNFDEKKAGGEHLSSDEPIEVYS